MSDWLNRLADLPLQGFQSPEDLARFELKHALPSCSISLRTEPELGDCWRLTTLPDGPLLSGGRTGLLYGAYTLIFRSLAGLSLPREASSSPRWALRMINCWDNLDGSVERGYAGRSLFFEGGCFSWDPARIRHLGRLMASVGLNVLCVNNVNVHSPAQQLTNRLLPNLAALADQFRPFGVRLMISVDFAAPLQEGLSTADPLAPAVQAWWKETAARVYRAVPDLAGFLIKADSENRPGPDSYGRNHAEGANMLAAAVAPYGGVLVWRAFVYNCHQDWRDSHTDRPMAAFERYMPLDGRFADNVILQIKHGPFDFQVQEPLSPLLLGLRHTSMAMEVQLAQEYTGHQIDIYTMLPMWLELTADLPPERLTAVAAVSNFGRDACLTGHPLAGVNLFGFGRFAWDPSVPPGQVIREWIRLTYPLSEKDTTGLTDLLMSSREIYAKYTAPLGICWMVTPHDHYGPSPSGYEFDQWGTYHRASRDAIGIDRTGSGTGYLLQYPPMLQNRYADPVSCPERLLLFFHRLPWDYIMQDGRTLVQRIYDDHFEGAEAAERLLEALRGIPFPEPDRSLILHRAEMQSENAQNWRDVINTFCHRLSGIPDRAGRRIYD